MLAAYIYNICSIQTLKGGKTAIKWGKIPPPWPYVHVEKILIVYDRPLIGAGPETILFENWKTMNCQTRLLALRVAISESHGSCSDFMFAFSLCNSTELKRYLALETLVNHRFIRILYRLFTLARVT
jgi:hypothetical protein